MLFFFDFIVEDLKHTSNAATIIQRAWRQYVVRENEVARILGEEPRFNAASSTRQPEKTFTVGQFPLDGLRAQLGRLGLTSHLNALNRHASEADQEQTGNWHELVDLTDRQYKVHIRHPYYLIVWGFNLLPVFMELYSLANL